MLRSSHNKGDRMNRIDVTPAERGKWKVLHNFIQYGIEHTTKEQADKEAQTLKDKFYPAAKKD
jgi:hypothetical protein